MVSVTHADLLPTTMPQMDEGNTEIVPYPGCDDTHDGACLDVVQKLECVAVTEATKAMANVSDAVSEVPKPKVCRRKRKQT